MFRPDPRVGDRQRACGKEPCQRKRRTETQARWRARNPSYATGYRLERRAAQAAGAVAACEDERDGDHPPPLRLPADLARYPWDLVSHRLGFAETELLMVLAIHLVGLVREARSRSSGRSAKSVNESKDE